MNNKSWSMAIFYLHRYSIIIIVKFNVIAEGVETEEQRQLLLDNGCYCYQGYLFGKPLPIAEFESLLKESIMF